jgi:hypothetical protein
MNRVWESEEVEDLAEAVDGVEVAGDGAAMEGEITVKSWASAEGSRWPGAGG